MIFSLKAFMLAWFFWASPVQSTFMGGSALVGPSLIPLASASNSITEQEAPATNNYSGTSKAFASNVTTGWLLVVVADENYSATPSISGTGTGCSSTSWTLQQSFTTTAHTPFIFAWTGIASGTGACTVQFGAGTIGITIIALSATTGSPSFDTTGVNSVTTSATMTVTCGSATTSPGDYGILFWGSGVGSSTAAASGWTKRINNTFDVTWTQTGITNGTTVSASMTSLASTSFNNALIITIAP